MSSICKLENQESQECNSVWARRPEHWGADSISQDLSLKAWELGVLMSKGRRRWMVQLQETERELALLLPFGSIQAISGLARPHWGGPSCLLTSPIQMLISSENTLKYTPRNNVLPAIWASLTHSSWPIKLSIANAIQRAFCDDGSVLDLHCPMWQLLDTSGYWALEMWLLHLRGLNFPLHFISINCN